MAIEHVTNLIDAYALGALEPDEVDMVESHLEGCEECRAYARRAYATANQLLLYLAAPTDTPPPSLRERTLARVRAAAEADAQRLDAPSNPRLDFQGSPTPPAAQPTPDAGAANPLARLLRSLLGAAGVEGAPTPQSGQADALLRELLTDPDVVIWPVGGTDDAPHASGRLIGSRARRRAVLLTSGLRQPGANREYQVWFLAGGKPQPNTLFTIDRAGHSLSVVRAAAPLSNFDTVAVTPEPAGGSPGPTGPIVLVGQLASEG
ncbi:MAG TPA: anti-sigma factor [Ktedonobacterales bacterium]|nr:anti-sigma factor [Ktedonobacterales bacterium]